MKYILILLGIWLEQCRCDIMPSLFSQIMPAELFQQHLTKLVNQYNLTETILYSGKNINDLGFYDRCIKYGHKYYLISIMFTPKQNIPSVLGFCLNTRYSQQDIQQFKQQRIQQITQFFKFKLDQSQVYFTDTSQLQYPVDLAFISVLLFFIFLLVLNCIGTLQLFQNSFFHSFDLKRNMLQLISEFKSRHSGQQANQQNQQQQHQQYQLNLQNNEQFDQQSGQQFDQQSGQQFDQQSGQQFYQQLRHESNEQAGEQRRCQLNLDFLDGVRSISTLMVVLGHEYFIRLQIVGDPQSVFFDYFKTWTHIIILSCMFAVDMFLFLSGFLVCYISIQKLSEKKKGSHHLIMYRYLRIMILYIPMILFYWQILSRIGDGPQWLILQKQTKQCDTFWPNLLLIDNLMNIFKRYDQCFGWGWYLALDFQLFVFSTIIISCYVKKKNVKLWLVFLIIQQIANSVNENIRHDLGLFNFGLNDNKYSEFWQYYIKGGFRGHVYYIGIYLGIMLYEFQNYLSNQPTTSHNIQHRNQQQHQPDNSQKPFLVKLKNYLVSHPKQRLFIQLAGLITMIFVGLIKHDFVVSRDWPSYKQKLMNVGERPLFIIGLIILTIPCFLQIDNIVKTVLENVLLRVISRLSFGIYLIHYQVIQYNVFSTRFNAFYSNWKYFNFFLSDISITVLASILATVLIEIPIMNMFKQKNSTDHSVYRQVNTSTDSSTRLQQSIATDDQILFQQKELELTNV